MAPFPKLVVLAAVLGVGTAIAAGAPAAITPPGNVFAQEIARDNTVIAELNPLRTKVTKFYWSWDTPACTLGPAATPTTGTFIAFTEPNRGPMAINKLGAFKKTIKLGPFVDGAITSNFTHTIVGRRVGGTVAGSVRSVMIETDAAGQNVRTCDSGVLTFKLIDKDTFAGLSSKKEPVVVKMNPARTKVIRLAWDWSGSCTLGPAATPETSTTAFVPDFLTGFTLKKSGAWGSGGRVDTGPLPDAASGITSDYNYNVAAKRTGNVNTGTITAGFVETNTASGQVIRTCASGPVKFNIKD